MNYKGKAQLSVIIISAPELEAEGDHIFASHAVWMAKTHPREGVKALHPYNVAKKYDQDGNAVFTLTEVYESAAGIDNHHKLGASWESVDSWRDWLNQCKVIGVVAAPIVYSLW